VSDLYEKAAEQALQNAQISGEMAPYCIGIGLALIAFGCFMFHLENNSIGYKTYLGRTLLGWLLGTVFLLVGLDCASNAYQAKHYRELFLIKKLYKSENKIHPISYPVHIQR